MQENVPAGAAPRPPRDGHRALPGFDDVRIESLLERRTLKWGRHGPGVLGAWIAEMDFPVAPEVRDALHRAVERGETGYPLRDIRTGLPAACSGWLDRSFGWSVPAERIFLVPDVVTGVGLGIGAYSAPGSAVVVPTPAYPPFFEIVAAQGRRAVEIPLVPDGAGPSLDIDSIDAALAGGAGTVLLCNPHNPVGRVFTRAELSALSRCVAARGARVVADEVHAPLTYPGHEHVPYASVSPEAAAHTVTLVSAAKGWNIPGLKCAQAVLTGDGDVARWRSLPFHSRHGASTLGIAAHIAAYTRGGPWLRDAVRYLDANRRFLADVLRSELPELGYRMPEGTYLAWLDCRALRLDDPAGFLLRDAGVAVSDGAFFGAAGRGFIRLNFATSRRILERIASALTGSVRARARHRAP
ncbi:MalY/PatB family protein [Streptomyces sp. DH37]|uniref:MalY/PatB family protein n=1 Tax=Streptomyces sp. DH37 TaxID=3040122 RepID=UPI002442413B|nr:pyridoxal phosphate-dependent aminotransferase [Streptomyces sp. DH37]MDG9701995.1 pyridoxal phosphate-dependent aminotransferase [Streptomyces sp. DH37]